MIKLKRVLIELLKIVIVFLITFSVFLYGVSMVRDEYQQQLRHIEPEKAAEQVNLFKFS